MPRHALLSLAALAVVVGSTPQARAQAQAATDEHTAAEVAGAPLPGDESGRVDAGEPEASLLRTLGRSVLFVPRIAFELTFAPVRGGVWAMDKYRLRTRLEDLFFNDARTISLYPIAHYESGFGVDVGARFIHRDLLGARERLSLHAGTGARYHQVAALTFDTRDRFDHVALSLHAEHERRPKEAFYGIGNQPPLDVDVMEVNTRYRQQLQRVALTTDLELTRALHVRAAGAIAALELGRSEVGVPIDEIYGADTLVGFDGYRYGYGELEVRWDSRTGDRLASRAVPATGSLAAAYVGRVAMDDRADYWRVGLDLQRFLALSLGPRVLSLRFHAEAVRGPRHAIPFTELPVLGGKTSLRGYPADRFRDRVAVLGSIEYQWDLARFAAASLFVDAGRVDAGIAELQLALPRVGYGVAVQLHGDASFVGRLSIASSIDGGVFLDLAFDPVFEIEPRVDRR